MKLIADEQQVIYVALLERWHVHLNRLVMYLMKVVEVHLPSLSFLSLISQPHLCATICFTGRESRLNITYNSCELSINVLIARDLLNISLHLLPWLSFNCTKMVDWSAVAGVAAVLSASSIPLVMSAASSGLLSSTGRYIIRRVFPSKGRCERLEWEDIEPHYRVHECREYYCPHTDGAHSNKCWQQTLALVFSRAWNSPQRRRETVEKPEILPLNRNYVCTNARVILAFILCTVDYKPWKIYIPGIAWSPKHLRFDDTHIRVKEFEDGTVVAHLRGSFKNNLTKGDIEGLLAGYPPWYRELVRMPHGPSVPHPIMNQNDINRAGWAVAVGLIDIEPLSAMPHDGALTDKPIERTYDVIKGRLLPDFPDDVNVKSAVQAVWYLTSRHTQSGVETYLSGQFDRERRDDIPKLSGSQATFAMRIFNQAPNIRLTSGDVATLTPILLPVVDAAFRGAYKVVSLLKNQSGKSFDWPPILMDPKRRIFVEDCGP